MKVRYIGETQNLVLTNGKIYQMLGQEGYFYRVIDDTNDDYLYEKELFQIVE